MMHLNRLKKLTAPMVSIKTPCLALGIFLFFSFSPLFAQNASITAEISRLETLSSAAGPERLNAFLSLARLQQLSGNPEAALIVYERALAAFPGNGRLLLEKGRLLISIGEYDKASAAVSALLTRDQSREIMREGRHLLAQLEAFRSGNTQILAALAEDPDFLEFRSGILFTLWRLTDLSSWKTRLIAEFPQSPEAQIAAADNGVSFAVTPLWLLFPGRESIQLSAPAASAPAAVPSTAPPAATPTPAPASPGVLLQTGLFSNEANAQSLAERLRRAGFQPQISRRQQGGADRWAVLVPGGADMNATMQRLRNAGFESFPVR